MEEKDTDTFEGNVYDGITCEGGVCYGRRYLSCFCFPGPGGEYASWEGEEGVAVTFVELRGRPGWP